MVKMCSGNDDGTMAACTHQTVKEFPFSIRLFSHNKFRCPPRCCARSHLVSLGRLLRVSVVSFSLSFFRSFVLSFFWFARFLVLSSLVPPALMFICLQMCLHGVFCARKLQSRITYWQMRDASYVHDARRRRRRRRRPKNENKLFSAMSLRYSVKQFTGFSVLLHIAIVDEFALRIGRMCREQRVSFGDAMHISFGGRWTSSFIQVTRCVCDPRTSGMTE